MALHDLPARRLATLLRTRELTSEEVVGHVLARAEADPCGAFVHLDADAAIGRARALDRATVGGVLHGLPIADKDLQLRAGTPTTFGSRAFAGFVAGESDALTTLLDRAGAVSIGKTATPEFGYAGYTSSLLHGHTTVPGHPGLGAGGSSGGAAAAVAARMLPVAPGSDAGGSVRIPAAACSVGGVKPGRGVVRVPASGAMGALVTPGALARDVRDAALLVRALTGHNLLPDDDPGPRRRVAVLRDFHPWRPITDTVLAPEAEQALARAVAALAGAGHDVEELVGPELPGYVDAFTTLWHASAAELDPTEAQLALFEPLTREFVLRGRALAPERIDAARARLTAIGERVVAAFAHVDAVLSPTTALPPRPVGWFGDDPEVNFRRQCEYTPHASFVNVAGLPAVSLPVVGIGDGLTMSVQVIGRPGGDATVLRLAHELEHCVAGELHRTRG